MKKVAEVTGTEKQGPPLPVEYEDDPVGLAISIRIREDGSIEKKPEPNLLK